MAHIVNVIEDPDNPGEQLLDLGHEVCESLGWKVGDTIEWIDHTVWDTWNRRHIYLD